MYIAKINKCTINFSSNYFYWNLYKSQNATTLYIVVMDVYTSEYRYQ